MGIIKKRSITGHFAFRPLLVGITAIGLAGCTSLYDVNDPYGYSGVSVGVGYDSGYAPYYGWYDDYYYPGTGYYIYDRRGSRHRWNDRHQRYWQARRHGHRSYREQWGGYTRGHNGRYADHRDNKYPAPRGRQRWRESRQPTDKGVRPQTNPGRRGEYLKNRTRPGPRGDRNGNKQPQTQPRGRQNWRQSNGPAAGSQTRPAAPGDQNSRQRAAQQRQRAAREQQRQRAAESRQRAAQERQQRPQRQQTERRVRLQPSRNSDGSRRGDRPKMHPR